MDAIQSAVTALSVTPLAFMLGTYLKCSNCCTECDCPPSQPMPEALKVTFSNLSKGSIYIDNLLSLSIQSCFGSGATGTVQGQGASDENSDLFDALFIDGRPLTGVTLTSGGSGYAILGRSEPLLTLSAKSGEGATFTPVFQKFEDACKVPTWGIQSVSVEGGTGYTDFEQLSVTLAEGDVELEGAFLELRNDREEPTLSIVGSADVEITLTKVTLGDAAGNPLDYWAISSVEINDGGSGYVTGEQLEIILGEDDVAFSGGYILAVAEEGALIEATVLGGGLYYHDTGVPNSVAVISTGIYYQENESLPAIVSDITPVLVQLAPSAGVGAVITAKVEENVSDPAFGQIKSLELTNPGDGYLSWGWLEQLCDLSYFNGAAIYLKRQRQGNPNFPRACLYRGCHGRTIVEAYYLGKDIPPTVQIIPRLGVGVPNLFDPPETQTCSAFFVAPAKDAPFACSKMEFIAKEPFGGQAAVTEQSSYKCDEIFEAESVTINLSAENFKVTRTYPTIQNKTGTCEATGSVLSGSFELVPSGENVVVTPGVGQSIQRLFSYTSGKVSLTMSVHKVIEESPFGSLDYYGPLSIIATGIETTTKNTSGVVSKSEQGAVFAGICVCDLSLLAGSKSSFTCPDNEGSDEKGPPPFTSVTTGSDQVTLTSITLNLANDNE